VTLHNADEADCARFGTEATSVLRVFLIVKVSVDFIDSLNGLNSDERWRPTLLLADASIGLVRPIDG
jgi:hypothetical protein